jgi:hypothetical protein
MKVRVALLIAIVASLIFISSKIVFSQEEATPESAQPPEAKSGVIQGEAAPSGANQEPETQWVWGEVVTTDPQNKIVCVKYLDYESDQEKQIDISADDKTTYENLNSVDELKPKDTVSIDYISVDGKNIAKNISVEKPETPAAPEAEIKPEDIAPAQAEPPVEQQQPQAQ